MEQGFVKDFAEPHDIGKPVEMTGRLGSLGSATFGCPPLLKNISAICLSAKLII